jgi:putative heme transporter
MDVADPGLGGEVVNELPPGPAARRRPGWLRVAQAALSLGVVAAIFVLVLPQIASYSSVWQTLTTLGWPQVTVVAAVSIFNLFTYWAQMVAAMPGLTLAQAAVNNQSSTTVANIMPGGGAIAVGVAVAMFRSWGFTGPEIGLLVSTTGVWNSFMKLALPVAALGLLAVTGEATGALIAPAAAGLGILAGSLVLFALALWRPSFARGIGNGLGRARSFAGRLVHRPPANDWGGAAVRFRDQTIRLLARRWIPLTLTTVISHLGLYAVLLVALRALGVSAREVSWAQVLAVFAFARLLSAIPITPGGLGVVELALIGGLYAAGHARAGVPASEFRAQVTAATLLFRTLTYGIQIPLGAFTYLIWQHKRSWRRSTSPDAAKLAHTRPENAWTSHPSRCDEVAGAS